MSAPQTPEIDFDEGKRLRDQGMKRSSDAAGNEWREGARTLIELLALTQEYVVSDDMWEAGLQAASSSNTALGHVFRWAAKEGFLTKTDRVLLTKLKGSHANPMTVWESLVYTGPKTGDPANPGKVPRTHTAWSHP